MLKEQRAVNDLLNAYGELELTHGALSKALFTRQALEDSLTDVKMAANNYRDALAALDAAIACATEQASARANPKRSASTDVQDRNDLPNQDEKLQHLVH